MKKKQHGCNLICLPTRSYDTLVPRVQILGHSLGAGTACMLAMLVRNNEQVGAAAGTASSDLVWRCALCRHANEHAAGLNICG
jgi:Lipase (class 3)